MTLVNTKTSQKIRETNFKSEKELHQTVERYIASLLNMEFIASEHQTSRGGIIDTLALDKENGAPVIIEYKIDKSRTILNQLVYYYDWLSDYKDTFNRLVKEKLGGNIEVNWSENIRLICIAKDYTEWDYALVEHLDNEIELYKYTYYANGLLNLQRINKKKKIIKSEAGEFDLEHHRSRGNKEIQKLFDELQKNILALDEEIEENPTQFYVGYKKDYNFAELHVYTQHLKIMVKAGKNFKDPKKMAKDISHRGWAVNREIKIDSKNQISYIMSLVKQSLNLVQNK
jgi:predicted transport protein